MIKMNELIYSPTEGSIVFAYDEDKHRVVKGRVEDGDGWDHETHDGVVWLAPVADNLPELNFTHTLSVLNKYLFRTRREAINEWKKHKPLEAADEKIR